MASFTSRLAGWAAGRLGGEKSRKKTMEFVDKTGVGKVLGLIGDAALLGGAGKLVGAGAQAMGFGKAAQAGTAGTTGLKAMPEMGKAISAVPTKYGAGYSIAPNFGGGAVDAVSKAAPSFLQRAGSMAGQAGSYLAQRPEIAAAGLNAYATARQGTLNREVQREAAAQRAKEFEQTFGQSESERKREIERQQRIAQMLAPLFQRIAGGQG